MTEKNNQLLSRLDWFYSTDRRRTITVAVLWIIGTISVYSQALFTRSVTMLPDYAVEALISLTAGILIANPGQALASFIGVMTISFTSLLFLALAPVSSGTFNASAGGFFQILWITLVFNSIIPIPLVMYLAATLIGSLIGERLI